MITGTTIIGPDDLRRADRWGRRWSWRPMTGINVNNGATPQVATPTWISVMNGLAVDVS